MQIKNAVPGARRAAHRVTQLAALIAATTLLVTFVVVDANATANSTSAAKLGSGVTAKYKSSLNDQLSSLALGGTTSIGVNVPQKYKTELANKLKTIRHRAPKSTTTTTTSAIGATTTTFAPGVTSTTFANGVTTTTFANGGTTTTLPNGTTTTTLPNGTTTTTTPKGTTTTTLPNGTTTTTTPKSTTTTTTTPRSTTTTTSPPVTTTTAASGSSSTYPTGVADSSEPSGQAPPGANAMTGYTQSYVDDFSGSALTGWSPYSGQPSGDSGSQWGGASHAVVSGGMLSLETFQDPNYGNEWVTGGVSQNTTGTYGAYFVRSRVTGAGPTEVELLFPASGWPPEVDFNESGGGTNAETATTIWAVNSSGTKSQIQVAGSVDLSQWHTWGVIWTPTSVTYTVDGTVWGTITNSSEVPQVPMRLDLQQQTWCSSGFACPSAPQQMDIDWVAEYQAN
jgi:Glycosyl hydrolases family 16